MLGWLTHELMTYASVMGSMSGEPPPDLDNRPNLFQPILSVLDDIVIHASPPTASPFKKT
jgi:hypothetical protein